MDNDVQLNEELQEITNLEACAALRQAGRTSGNMLRLAEMLATEMAKMAVEIAKEKIKKGLDSDEKECIIE